MAIYKPLAGELEYRKSNHEHDRRSEPVPDIIC
jgi:hypothetical protein